MEQEIGRVIAFFGAGFVGLAVVLLAAVVVGSRSDPPHNQ